MINFLNNLFCLYLCFFLRVGDVTMFNKHLNKGSYEGRRHPELQGWRHHKVGDTARLKNLQGWRHYKVGDTTI